MPRKQRCRFIGGLPKNWSLLPEESGHAPDYVVLSLDEFEAIRLIDREGLTQEQSAQKMGVARTTVTAIYESARKKIAVSLVDGIGLLISGGTYRLAEEAAMPTIIRKGTETMRIAVTYENGEIFQHFGHTEKFKLYDFENGKLVSEQVVDTNGQGHGALAGFLKQCGADALICGGIGMGARMALQEAGVKLYGGVGGNADEAARKLAAGTLEFDPDAKCDHHGEHHHGGDCGQGGCGHGQHHHGGGCGNGCH